MRGDERVQEGMFSYVSLEQRIPQDHPLRAVRKLTDTVLGTLSPEFDVLSIVFVAKPGEFRPAAHAAQRLARDKGFETIFKPRHPGHFNL
jgi:hypothetical protein